MTSKYTLAWIVALALAAPACGAQSQTSSPAPMTESAAPPAAMTAVQPPSAAPAPPLFDLQDSDIKFRIESLMSTLRDQRHEGWVLAAYPDPNTHRPLIGAGFSLDVPAREHSQSDPLNPHQFFEPSSAQLWQAAGLDPASLQNILERFNHDMNTWSIRQYRRKIRAHALAPELTEENATRLLRISTIQAVYNARAYCRNFDLLTGAQQMALSQLVYQMGVNLEEFSQFLSAINGDGVQPVSLDSSAQWTDSDHWKAVQATLMDSQWARRYSGRASSVIAMFDPNYLDDPRGAQQRVEVVLHPPKHHRRQQSAHMVRTGSHKTGKSSAKQASAARKRKAV
ncbi:MAG: hypothetical protein JO300_11280 [Silvibacterium sp.]|nr:hypothetical protein [Silvibacterium sp.]MBV8438459.1 hypothetical protein [Silvibacterium sp.]